TKEFKEEAGKLAQNSNKPAAQIARDLNMSNMCFTCDRSNWRKRDQMPSPILGLKVRKKKKFAVERKNSKLLARSAIFSKNPSASYHGNNNEIPIY
ncbi:MAG: hypothetical protein ACRDHZ_07810, partial [Ktedonobacteraceae bacterium]